MAPPARDGNTGRMEVTTRGEPVHTRTLGVTLADAGDGEVEARGSVLDLRKRGLVPMGGELQTGGVIHHMRVEARIDRATCRVREIRAEQPSVAFEPGPGTGGECCRDPVRRIEALAGAALDAGFAKRLSGAIGGPRGCSHVLTLAQLLGSSAAHALDRDAARHGPAPQRPRGQRLFDRSLSVDGAAGTGALELALQLADVHFAPTPLVADAADRLAAFHEVRAHALVELDGMTLAGLRIGEREREAGAMDGGAWRDRSDAVAALVGRPALGGMAGALFAAFGDRAEDRPLLDVLLNLAPTVIQCMPGLIDRWGFDRGDGDTAHWMAGGGMIDSCYMWRAEGALQGGIGLATPAAPRPRGATAAKA